MKVFVAFWKPESGAVGLNVGALELDDGGGGGGGSVGCKLVEGGGGGAPTGIGGGGGGSGGASDEILGRPGLLFDETAPLPTFLNPPPPAGLKPAFFGGSRETKVSETGCPAVAESEGFLTASPAEMPIFLISFSSLFLSRSFLRSASPEFCLALSHCINVNLDARRGADHGKTDLLSVAGPSHACAWRACGHNFEYAPPIVSHSGSPATRRFVKLVFPAIVAKSSLYLAAYVAVEFLQHCSDLLFDLLFLGVGIFSGLLLIFGFFGLTLALDLPRFEGCSSKHVVIELCLS